MYKLQHLVLYWFVDTFAADQRQGYYRVPLVLFLKKDVIRPCSLTVFRVEKEKKKKKEMKEGEMGM